MEILETETTVVVLNAQPEFTAKTRERCSADYFILCDESLAIDTKSALVAGVPVANWVARACERKPKMLPYREGDNVLEIIRPYISDADYSVVLYSNTPLVTKGHIRDLLGFVSTKRMNVCNLKKGFVFKNDYISNVDEVYSIDTYDFASKDFFEVNSIEDLAEAEIYLQNRIIAYHSKKGVSFESARNLCIDASVEIGAGTMIATDVSLFGNTSIGLNVKLGENVTIKNSKIGNDVVIADNSVVIGSIIKDGTIVRENVTIDSSAIMERVKIEKCAKVMSTKIKEGAKIAELAQIFNARIAENVSIGIAARVIGESIPALVMQNAEIGAGAVVVDASIANGNIVKSCEVRRGEA